MATKIDNQLVDTVCRFCGDTAEWYVLATNSEPTFMCEVCSKFPKHFRPIMAELSDAGLHVEMENGGLYLNDSRLGRFDYTVESHVVDSVRKYIVGERDNLYDTDFIEVLTTSEAWEVAEYIIGNLNYIEGNYK